MEAQRERVELKWSTISLVDLPPDGATDLLFVRCLDVFIRMEKEEDDDGTVLVSSK